MRQGLRRENSIGNKLWIARKRAGYSQKVVATLLGNRSLSVISEYEKGRKLPSLRTALKLEHIYGTPLAGLYPGLFAELAGEISAAKERFPAIHRHEPKNREEATRGPAHVPQAMNANPACA